MKRKLLLPALAIVLAVGGAYASNKFAPVYFEGGDNTCTIQVPDPGCDPIGDQPCMDQSNNLQHYYKADENATQCELLTREN